MKKFILPIAFFIFWFLVTSSNTYAQSSDCRKEFSDQRSVCQQSVVKCSTCSGPNLNPVCLKDCDQTLDKCTQAKNVLNACLGVDKKPLKLQPKQSGYLTCEDWKMFMIVGTAENCKVPVYSENKLWCLNSADEVDKPLYLNRPGDYILDFDPNSCIPTEDDLKQFKTGSPLTSGSSSRMSQNQVSSIGQKSQGTNPISKFVRDVQNYFKPSGVNAGKDVKPDFSVDKPPFKDPKTVAEQAKMSGPAQAINSWIEEVFGEAAPVVKISDPETLNRIPKLSEKEVSEAKQKFDSQKSPYQIPVLDGEAMVKLPGSNDWILLKEGDRIVPGSTLFTAWDTRMLLMIRDKGIVEVLSFTEITVSEQGLEQADKEGKTSTDVRLHTGEIEVNVEGGVYTAGLQVQMTNAVAGVRGTHFWVNYDQKKHISTIGVYKGEVEVTPSGSSKSTLVSPDGDKPGVVVVTQKLSFIKLAFGGLVIAGIGAAVLILRKRVFPKRSAKKN